MSKFIKTTEIDKDMMFLEYYLRDVKGIIAGGCFRNIEKKEEIKDIDMFFESREDYVKAIEIFSSRKEDFEFYEENENENITVFKDLVYGLRLELINVKFGKPKDIIEKFDFTVTQAALYRNSEDKLEFIYHKDLYDHLEDNKLTIDYDWEEIEQPYGVFRRMIKYVGYGYKVDFNTQVKIIESIRNQSDFDVEEYGNILYSD